MKGLYNANKRLDVSEFQGNVDWEKVKAAGYQFAMLRAGYGLTRLIHNLNAMPQNVTGLVSRSESIGSAMP